MKFKSLYVAVLLPILVMAAWLANLVTAARSGTEVEIAIVGFDPRDLLAGHYLEYRLDLQNTNLCHDRSKEIDEDICVCLNIGTATGRATGSAAFSCGAQSCSLFLKGRCNYGRFTTGNDRFYFSETFTTELKVVPSNASIVLSVNKDGGAIVKGLKVDNIAVDQWLKNASK